MARVLPLARALPSLAALTVSLQRCAEELPRDELPELAGVLETTKARLWTRLSTPERASTTTSGTSELLDARAMAQRLQVPESWLREHARRGAIPCVHVGRYMRFDPREVMAHLQSADVIDIRHV